MYRVTFADMTQIGQGSVRGLPIGRHMHLWQLCSGSIKHPHPVCRPRVSDQPWSGHQGMLEGSWGNGSWSYLHSLAASGWGMMTMNVLTSAISSNIQQHGGPDTVVCGEWRVTASTRRDRNRSRTSWCRARLGGLGATWPDMNTLDLNGSVSYEFVSTSAIQRLAAWIHIWALSGWLELRYWPTQNMRHAVSKYNDWHPMYYSAYFTVLAP